MDRNEQILIPAFGDFLYNPDSKRLHYDDGAEVGPSTYERPLWTPPWYNFWSQKRYFNPSHYATASTAAATASWVLRLTTEPLTVTVKENWDVLGNITAPERLLLVRNNVTGVEDTFNAGLVAFTRDKNGDSAASRSFRAELKLARLIP